ncbi:MAG TPA: helix-turn-helix domain-containing protein [Streptosporangiaceae bacterium]
MPTDEHLERVRQLREQGRNPKEIARILGIRPAEASQLVRAAAVLAQGAAPEPALAGCWISPGWSTGLSIGDHPGWPLDDDPAGGSQGLISVLVARRVRFGKVSACGYLADVYCLGVKNALGPEPMDERDLRGFVRRYFSGYRGDPVEAPIELAREIVLGSVEYARSLGFDPHPDFAAAAGHLGPWIGPGAISFGKDGKPLYVFGPYDDHRSVIRTLKRNVGRGNFEVLAISG